MLAGVLVEETSDFLHNKINLYHAKVCSKIATKCVFVEQLHE